MDRTEAILQTDYINMTELIEVIEALGLSYTRQGMGVLQRAGKDIFQYDAKAFGSYFFRKNKVFDIVAYVCKSKGENKTSEEIEKAISSVVNKKRVLL